MTTDTRGTHVSADDARRRIETNLTFYRDRTKQIIASLSDDDIHLQLHEIGARGSHLVALDHRDRVLHHAKRHGRPAVQCMRFLDVDEEELDVVLVDVVDLSQLTS